MRAPLPRNVHHELACQLRYPLRIETPAGAARFRRSRWERFDESRDGVGAAIRHREISGWLYSGADRIGLLELEEFDADPGTHWDELWEIADGLSEQAGEAIEAMREAFGDVFVSAADWGPIVLVTGAWIAPAHRTRVEQRGILDAVLPVVTPGYGIAVLVAYPQGFDGDERGDAADAAVENLGGFEWRQRALMRHYQRALGFTAFDTKEARREVMWRARPDVQRHVLQRLKEERD